MTIKRTYLAVVLTAVALSPCSCIKNDNPATPGEKENGDDMVEDGGDDTVVIDMQLLGQWGGRIINTTYPDTNNISFFLGVENDALIGTLSILDRDSDGVAAAPISKTQEDRVRVQNLTLSDTLSFRTDSVAICIASVGGGQFEKAIEVLNWHAVITDTVLSGSFEGTRVFIGPEGFCRVTLLHKPADAGIWQVKKVE